MSLTGQLGILARCPYVLKTLLLSILGGRLRGTERSVQLEFDLSPVEWLGESAGLIQLH